MGMFDYIKKLTYFKEDESWYYYEGGLPYLTPEAPPEAIESYNYWKNWFLERYGEELEKDGKAFKTALP